MRRSTAPLRHRFKPFAPGGTRSKPYLLSVGLRFRMQRFGSTEERRSRMPAPSSADYHSSPVSAKCVFVINGMADLSGSRPWGQVSSSRGLRNRRSRQFRLPTAPVGGARGSEDRSPDAVLCPEGHFPERIALMTMGSAARAQSPRIGPRMFHCQMIPKSGVPPTSSTSPRPTPTHV